MVKANCYFIATLFLLATIGSNTLKAERVPSSTYLVENLLKAKTISQLETADFKKRDLKLLELVCRAQLAEKIPPTSCFKWAHRRYSLGQIDEQTRRRWTIRINEICSTLPRLPDPKVEIPNASSMTPPLASACQKKLQVWKSLEDHRLQHEEPFQWILQR